MRAAEAVTKQVEWDSPTVARAMRSGRRLAEPVTPSWSFRADLLRSNPILRLTRIVT